MSRLLGAADVRRIATELDIRPAKKWGQNFVIDPNTVERIVRVANVSRDDVAVEVGPGLGSLTLALLRPSCPLRLQKQRLAFRCRHQRQAPKAVPLHLQTL